jgi:hypothetical protein
MPNGSKCHRPEANIYSIECRTGGEAGGCSGLKRRRSQKAEGVIERKSDWCNFIGRPSKKGKEKGCSHLEKREGSGSSKGQAPREREGMATERIEKTAEDLRMARKNGQNWILIQ